MGAVSYVLADDEGRLHLFTLDEETTLDIPVGWTYMPDADAEARFFAQGHSAVEQFQARVGQVLAPAPPIENVPGSAAPGVLPGVAPAAAQTAVPDLVPEATPEVTPKVKPTRTRAKKPPADG